MKYSVLLLIGMSVFGFSGCKKEVAPANVTYSVYEVSAGTPEYGIEYTSDKAGGTMVTSYNTEHYSSGKIELEQGQFISLKVTCTAPVYELQLSIFVNGNLWKTGELNSPTSSVTVSGNIPQD